MEVLVTRAKKSQIGRKLSAFSYNSLGTDDAFLFLSLGCLLLQGYSSLTAAHAIQHFMVLRALYFHANLA